MINEREEGVVALHLPIEFIKARSGWEPEPGFEPSTYLPVVRWLSHSATEVSVAGFLFINRVERLKRIVQY